MVVTVVKIESRSFLSAEIQPDFRTENTRSDYNHRKPKQAGFIK
jgi:hypothetical protein